MTKSEAKEFVKLNPGGYAHHTHGDIFVSSNSVHAHHIVNACVRPHGQPHEQWLDDAFSPGLPEDGWFVGMMEHYR